MTTKRIKAQTKIEAGKAYAIDEALSQIEASGGTTVTSRTEIPGMGAFAYFKDPEGNVMGLWETTTSEA